MPVSLTCTWYNEDNRDESDHISHILVMTTGMNTSNSTKIYNNQNTDSLRFFADTFADSWLSLFKLLRRRKYICSSNTRNISNKQHIDKPNFWKYNTKKELVGSSSAKPYLCEGWSIKT